MASRSGCEGRRTGPLTVCHSFVPQTTLPHPILQEEGPPRPADERHCVSPSIIKTIPGLLFSDWGLPNPLIIPVHQVDDSLGDNQWLLPHTPTLTHLPKLTSNKYSCEQEDLTTKGASSTPPPSQTSPRVTRTPSLSQGHQVSSSPSAGRFQAQNACFLTHG